MKSNAIILAVAAWVGVASATPALSRDRIPECPSMPPSGDEERSGSGGLSVQIGGFGVSGNRARTHSSNDVMMRYGGFEDWSAAVVMSHSCQINRELHRDNLGWQRDYLMALRERLLGHAGAELPRAPQPTRTSNGTSRSWTFAELWEPLSTSSFVPALAIYQGVRAGVAELDCRLSRQGLSDCYVTDETPRGYGFGNAALRYASELRLKSEVLDYDWADRRIRQTITLSR